MTRDFTLVRTVFASSLIGRSLATLDRRVHSAWLASSTGATARGFRDRLRTRPAARVIRTFATTIAIAAIVVLMLMQVLPRTIAPAMPWTVFVLIAAFAVAIAWQAEAILIAWPASRLAQRLRR